MDNQFVIPTAEPFFFAGDQIGCLLVHGFTGTPKEMLLLGKFLKNQGHTVLGIRLAGHATQPADMLRTRYQDWLISLEDGLHLLKNCCEKIFVIGLSMGGMLTLTAASRYPIAGAVALSTPYRMPDDWRLKFLNILRYIMPEVSKGKDDWHDPQNGMGHISYSRYPIPSIAEFVKLMDVMHSALPEVKVPVLLIQSTKDAMVLHDHAQQFYDHLVACQDKEVVLIENSGHVIIEDTDREIVFENIAEFIRRFSKPRKLS